MTASMAGSSRVVRREGGGVVAGEEGVDHARDLVAGGVADDGDDARCAPCASQPRVATSSPE